MWCDGIESVLIPPQSTPFYMEGTFHADGYADDYVYADD